MTEGFVVKTDGFPHIDKDPNAKLNYTWDWSAWMTQAGAGTIGTAIVTPGTGLGTSGSPQISGGLVTQVLQGGTAGNSYPVTCHIETDTGLIDERTVYIDVKER